MRVLVVEDEADLAAALARALTDEDFAVEVAADGDEGLFHATEIPYDAIVLDVMLPRRDGWDVLRGLRAAGRTTIAFGAWTWAPTTISPSPSRSTSWWRACAPSSGGRRCTPRPSS
jgi:CheY-like chemotaxis protein